MRKYILMAILFCLLPGCTDQSLPPPPPPPPMPFAVVWAPNEAPVVQVAEQTLLPLMQACNGGSLEGSKISDAGFPEMTFFNKPLEKGQTLQAGKLYFLEQGRLEFTTAVMFNLTVTKKGEIQECMAEKVVYRSR